MKKDKIKIIFGEEITKKQVKQVAIISEKSFCTKKDKTQMRSDYRLFLKIAKKFPDFFSILTLNNKIIGDNILLPSTKELMKSFLENKLNEKQLTDILIKSKIKKPECLFLAEIIIDKEYRRRGYASFLLDKALKHLKHIEGHKLPIFYWAWSKEGEFFTVRELEKEKVEFYFKN
jgi:N-acetylglutamate synthase-like GNAT family acetyltransferase